MKRLHKESARENGGSKSLGRRSFLDICLRGTLSIFGGLTAYSFFRYLQPSKATGEMGSGTMIPLAELPPGWSKKIRHQGKPVIVVRTEDKIYALSAVCTHLGCIVHWKDEGDCGKEMGDDIHCVCHAGVFDLNGNVLSGPPPRPLPSYSVRIVHDQIIVGEERA